MSRRRRLYGCSSISPAAAEVLEARALLSAGAAAVHAATHHAAIQTQAVESLAPFHKTLTTLVTITDSPASSVAGNFSLSNVNAAVGSKVKASFSFPVSSGGTTFSIKGTFEGTVDSVQAAGGLTTLTLDPTGGSIAVTEKAGGQTFKATAFPDGTQVSLVFYNGSFVRLGVSDRFPPSPTGPLAGKSISMLFYQPI